MQKSPQTSHVKPARDSKLDYSVKEESLYSLIFIIKVTKHLLNTFAVTSEAVQYNKTVIGYIKANSLTTYALLLIL